MNKALEYAENELGVHEVYQEAIKVVEEIDVISGELDVAHDNKRAHQEDMADREANLLSEERAKHPEMSNTALEQRLRILKRSDPELKKIREDLNRTLADISGGEYDLAVLNARLRVKVARMEELGGYLQYLAAVKLEVSKQNQKANTA